MWVRFMWGCTSEICSTPPPIATGTPLTMQAWAAMATVWRPEEQKRLTVAPAVVTGQPAQSAALRPTLVPVAPSGLAQPTNTSSDLARLDARARSMACLIAWPAIAAPWVLLNSPRNDLVSPVLAVETTTASRMRYSP